MGRSAKIRHRRQRRARQWFDTWFAWFKAGVDDGSFGLRCVHYAPGCIVTMSTEPVRPGGVCRRYVSEDFE